MQPNVLIVKMSTLAPKNRIYEMYCFFFDRVKNAAGGIDRIMNHKGNKQGLMLAF